MAPGQPHEALLPVEVFVYLLLDVTLPCTSAKSVRLNVPAIVYRLASCWPHGVAARAGFERPLAYYPDQHNAECRLRLLQDVLLLKSAHKQLCHPRP